MTIALITTIAAVITAGAVTALADRAARAAAWRQIALERRWNQEQRIHKDRHR